MKRWVRRGELAKVFAGIVLFCLASLLSLHWAVHHTASGPVLGVGGAAMAAPHPANADGPVEARRTIDEEARSVCGSATIALTLAKAWFEFRGRDADASGVKQSRPATMRDYAQQLPCRTDRPYDCGADDIEDWPVPPFAVEPEPRAISSADAVGEPPIAPRPLDDFDRPGGGVRPTPAHRLDDLAPIVIWRPH